MEELYREILLDNYRDKSNKRKIEDSISLEGVNPSCGDEVTLYVKLKDYIIDDISYEGQGCSICMASSNMLCKALRKKDCSKCEELIKKVRDFIVESKDVDFQEDEEEIESLIGIRKLSARTKCAMLSWNTAQQIFKEFNMT